MTLSPRAKRIGLLLGLVAVLACVGAWVASGPNTGTKLVSFALRKSLVYLTRRDAEKGIAEDQYNLGYYYSIGHGVERNQTEAVKWYRKAAEQDYDRAQYSLGLHYQNGAGVAKDWVEAVAWYEVADKKRAAGTGGHGFSRHACCFVERHVGGANRVEQETHGRVAGANRREAQSQERR